MANIQNIGMSVTQDHPAPNTRAAKADMGT